MIRTACLILAMAATPVMAQDYKPEDVPHGQPDYHLSQAGDYRLDPYHTAVVIARAASGLFLQPVPL